MQFLNSIPELHGVTSRPDIFNQYPLHFHANMEIGYVREGFRIFSLHQRLYRIEKGALMVVFPFQPHEFPDDNEGHGQLICCHPLSIGCFTTLLLTMLPAEPVIPADRVSIRLRMLLDLMMDTPENEHRTQTLNALFTALFWELLEILPMSAHNAGWSGDAEKLLITCMNDYRDPEFTLERLAHTCGMSSRSVSRFFSERMGISFPRFNAMLRLQYALDQLKDHVTITEAALSGGFGSMCSFNRVFREVYGIPPREYVRRNLADSD